MWGRNWTKCAQVDNKTDLEYQAGQDDKEEGANEDQQQKPADGSKPDEKQQPEGAGEEEEQQQDVPEQVLRIMSLFLYRRQTAQRMAVLCSCDAYHSDCLRCSWSSACLICQVISFAG